MKRWLWCSLVFVISCGGTSPPSAGGAARSPMNPPAAASPEQTGNASACTRDDECFCRVFNGARFEPGRAPSTCCSQPAGCTDAAGANVQAGHCMSCVYD
jgi:hypothetical protein